MYKYEGNLQSFDLDEINKFKKMQKMDQNILMKKMLISPEKGYSLGHYYWVYR